MEGATARKRGRKPKATENEIASLQQQPPPSEIQDGQDAQKHSNAEVADFITLSQDVTQVGQSNSTLTVQKNKRGRKPKQVFMCNDDEEAVGRCMSDDENVVLNLKVFDNFADEIIEPPDGYNLNGEHDAFLSKPYELGDFCLKNHTHDEDGNHITKSHETHVAKLAANKDDKQSNLKVVQLLKDFEEKNKHNEWPSTTSIHCYWCCNSFNNVPFGIPVKYINEKFHVIGCFCSLECCAAHNMKHYDSSDEMWERYMLINMLARRLGKTSIVKPAPDRLALKMFGGHMDINEFRTYCETGKVIISNFPPMMTLTQQLEESNESDITSDLKYIPIDTDRINKYKEKMKLKRQKPISNFANTLDHAMNLKFSA